MTQPTKESLDRAGFWCFAFGLRFFDPDECKFVANPVYVNSLALEFDRVRLEAKAYHTQHLSDQLNCAAAELRAKLAALNQPAGEKEG